MTAIAISFLACLLGFTLIGVLSARQSQARKAN